MTSVFSADRQETGGANNWAFGLGAFVLALFTSTVHAATAVGATPGSHQVTPSGAFTYNIPILVPPGTAGVGFLGDGEHTAGSRFDAADPEAISPFGGNPNIAYFGATWRGQAVPGLGSFYGVGSWQDRLLEAYGGVHDRLNQPIWYNELGNIRQGMSSMAQFLGEIANGLNVLVATPFVAASMVPTYSYSMFSR